MGNVTDGTTTATSPSSLNFSNGFTVSQPGGAGTAATIDGSGFVRTTTDQSIGGNKTFTGNTTVGNTTVSSGNTFTAGAGTSSGSGATSGVNVATSGLTTGTLVNVANTNAATTTGTLFNVDTGTAAFSGNAVNIQSTGNFTGTLVNLSANNTTAGTILGISATTLQTGRVIDANLGSAVYTGTGAIRLTANSASTGTLLAVSGTTLGANNGVAASFATGTDTGTQDAASKAVRVVLGTQGHGYYANAASGYAGNFVELQENGTTVFAISGSGGGTANTVSTSLNIAQSGSTTFSTGTGQVSLNGNTVLADAKTLTAGGTTSTFNFSASTAQFDTSSGQVNLNGNTVLAQNKSLSVAAGSTGNIDFSNSSGTFSTSSGTNTLNGNVSITANKTFAQNGTGTFSTGSGANSLNGDVTVASGKTITAAQNVTTGTAVNLTNAGTQTTGKVLNIDTGAGAFSTNGGGVSVTSTGAFTGTLARLTANSTTSGTVLGIQATALATGKAIDVDLGTGVYTGTGAINVTANSASSGTLVNISGTSLGGNNGTGVKIATGTPTGTDPTITKALALALGNTSTAGTGLYINAGSSYQGNLIDARVNAVSVFTVAQGASAAAVTIGGNATFSTGTGAVTLNGNTSTASGVTVTAGSGITTGTAVTVSSGLTTGKGVAISVTGTGQTTGQAMTIDTGTNVFTSTAGGALGITANSSTSGVVVGISATGLTNTTPGKALAVTLGTAGTGIFVNTSAAYTGNLLNLQMNGTSIFSVTEAGAKTGSTGTVIKTIELGTCTHPGGLVTNWVCGSGGAATTIAWANLAATDAVVMTGTNIPTGTGIVCSVNAVTAATSYSIRCTGSPANGTVFNILVVRR
ncbi:MAG: S-layer family protein [Chloroflexi bacterium]|nr:MAG: S-layer family protein [Chloroflexota bacterium]